MVKPYKQSNDPQQWLKQVAELRRPTDIALLQNAVDLYENQDPLLQKGLYIAEVLLGLGLDSETIAAAIAYPALKTHEIHIDTITDCLGEVSRKLLHDVMQMQTLSKLQQHSRGHHQVENLRKMLLAIVTDVRAVLVVLVERIWMLHDAKNSPAADQQKLAHETLAVFAPLANRLGVWQLKWEMEDLSLRYLEPEVYTSIAKWLASRRQEREAYIQNFIQIVTDLLHKEAHIERFEISGRVKHIYSIYNKMKRKSANIEAIYDISAIRVLVPEVDDCYSVLSILQNHWQYVIEEFDDYISQPKPNGYRSIHTVVLGPQDRYIEVQIRTFQMHQESELGVASHWQYKEGVLQPSSYEGKIALLRQIIAWQEEVVSANPQSEQTIQDLFADRIYVFTPLGDIVDLPQGSTPLDFAYQVHSEVGHRCKGAKVDNKLVPLTYQLQTGQRVEILTSKQANPSRDWLNPHLGYLKTPRARAKAQHWFRVKDAMQNIMTGRELLEKELKKSGFGDKIDLGAIAEKFNYKNSDDLLAALALGEVRLAQIIHQLRPASVPHAPAAPARPSAEPSPGSVQILGINNLLTQIARCCKPLPGDAIIGYVTRTRGVTIHRRDCNNIQHAIAINQQRLLEVEWGEKTAGHYPVDLVVKVADRSGLLRDITTLLAGEKINVLGLQTQKAQQSEEVDIFLTIEINSKDQLKKAIELLQQINNVIEVRRR